MFGTPPSPWRPNAISPFNTLTEKYLPLTRSQLEYPVEDFKGPLLNWGIPPDALPDKNIRQLPHGYCISAEWYDAVDSLEFHQEAEYCNFVPSCSYQPPQTKLKPLHKEKYTEIGKAALA